MTKPPGSSSISRVICVRWQAKARRLAACDAGLAATVGRLVVAAAATAAGVWAVQAVLPEDTEPLVEAVAVAVGGVVTFVVAGLAVGLREIRQLAGAITGRGRAT